MIRTEWAVVLMIAGGIVGQGVGDAVASFPDGSPEQCSAVSDADSSNCAHTVLTASENPENSRIVATPSDMKSAGIGAGQ